MKNLIRALAIATAFATVAVPFAARAGDAAPATEAPKAEAFGRLTIDQVNALIASKGGYIFDNNSKDSYAKGHVPTAKWVAFNDVKPADLPADKASKLVFYCGNEQCMACHKAAETALNLGYKNVFIMPAGIMGWEKAKQKIEA